jgi:SAM-dependent methyltransferase
MTDNELQRQYDLRFARSAEYRKRVWNELSRNFFDRLVPANASVLDLGAGWCEFINASLAHKKDAMDLNPRTAEFAAPGVQVLSQDCSAKWALPDNILDTVFTSNFLEHLPDKGAVERTILEIFRCLKPGGRLICMGPNMAYIGGPYWDFWDHHVALTDKSLQEVLELNHFAMEQVVPRFLPYSMSQGWQPPVFFLRIYLRLPVLWRFWGKQFLVVAKKP